MNVCGILLPNEEMLHRPIITRKECKALVASWWSTLPSLLFPPFIFVYKWTCMCSLQMPTVCMAAQIDALKHNGLVGGETEMHHVWNMAKRGGFIKTTYEVTPEDGSTLVKSSGSDCCWWNCQSSEGNPMQKQTKTSDTMSEVIRHYLAVLDAGGIVRILKERYAEARASDTMTMGIRQYLFAQYYQSSAEGKTMVDNSRQ